MAEQEPLTCTCKQTWYEMFDELDPPDARKAWWWTGPKSEGYPHAVVTFCPGCGDRLYFLPDGTPAVERRAELVPASVLDALYMAQLQCEQVLRGQGSDVDLTQTRKLIVFTLGLYGRPRQAAFAAANQEAATEIVGPICPFCRVRCTKRHPEGGWLCDSPECLDHFAADQEAAPQEPKL